MAARLQQNYQLYRRYIKNLALMYQRREDLQTYVELLLTLSVIVIFSLFAIRPTFVTITELFKQIEEKEDTIARLDDKIDALTQAREIYDNNSVTIALIDTAVPGEPLPALYTRQFEGVNQRNSTPMVGVNIGEAKIFGAASSTEEASGRNEEEVVDRFPSDSSSLVFSANSRGPYINLVSLAEDIENMRRPIFIDSFILRNGGEDFPGEVLFNFEGRVPYLPE